MSARVFREPRVVTVRPGSIHGNVFFESAQTVTVLYTGRWTLLLDAGETRAFEGVGSVRVELDPRCAYAIRNDGGADLHVIVPDIEGIARVLAEPLMRIAGVDGCRRGWIAIVKDGDRVETQLCTNDEELLALLQSCAVVAIDVPVGLAERGPRPCDHHARRFLGRRSSCVFPAPLRSLLVARDYAEANRVSNDLQKRGISKQGWAIVPKVHQIDNLLQRHRELRARVYEVHPEVSFAYWNDGALETKHSQGGLAVRRALVRAHFGEMPPVPRGAREDDLLDAFAALWTAERILVGKAQTLGDAHLDLTGLPMRVY
jgi:predicted RNase H-like nuclease